MANRVHVSATPQGLPQSTQYYSASHPRMSVSAHTYDSNTCVLPPMSFTTPAASSHARKRKIKHNVQHVIQHNPILRNAEERVKITPHIKYAQTKARPLVRTIANASKNSIARPQAKRTSKKRKRSSSADITANDDSAPMLASESFFTEKILKACDVSFDFESEKSKVLKPPPTYRLANLSQHEKDMLVSHDDVQSYKKEKAALIFSARLFRSWIYEMLGGTAAAKQVSDPQARMRALLSAVKVKAGPEGANLLKADRALQELASYAYENNIPNGGIPATAILVSAVIAKASDTARKAAKGSQGGATVGKSILDGFLWASNHLQLPIQVDSVVAEGEAPRKKKVTNPRQAGTLPLKIYAHFEYIASLKKGKVNRHVQTYARILVAGSLLSRLRMVDVLRSRFIEPRDEHESEWTTLSDGKRLPPIITSAKFSKDGAPIEVCIPPIGVLGPLTWWPEILAMCKRYPFMLPAFHAERPNSNKIQFATRLLPRVVCKTHASHAWMHILSLAPLHMSAEEWTLLRCTLHSMHGSPADIAVAMFNSAGAPLFSDEEINELGLWRRRAPTPSEAALPSDACSANKAVSRSKAQDTSRHMSKRYTQGTGRVGRVQRQMRVMQKFILLVSTALAKFGKSWKHLPKGREDLQILKRI